MGIAAVVALLIVLFVPRFPAESACVDSDTVDIVNCSEHMIRDCTTVAGNASERYRVIVRNLSAASCLNGNLSIVVDNSGPRWIFGGITIEPQQNNSGSRWRFASITIRGTHSIHLTMENTVNNGVALHWLHFGLPSFFQNIYVSLEASLIAEYNCSLLAKATKAAAPGNNSAFCPSVSVVGFGDSSSNSGGRGKMDLEVQEFVFSANASVINISSDGSEVRVVDLPSANATLHWARIAISSPSVALSAVSGGNVSLVRLPSITASCVIWVYPGSRDDRILGFLTLGSSFLVSPTKQRNLSLTWTNVTLVVENFLFVRFSNGSAAVVTGTGVVTIVRALILVERCSSLTIGNGRLLHFKGTRAANVSIVVRRSSMTLFPLALVQLVPLQTLDFLVVSIVASCITVEEVGDRDPNSPSLVAAIVGQELKNFTLALTSCNISVVLRSSATLVTFTSIKGSVEAMNIIVNDSTFRCGGDGVVTLVTADAEAISRVVVSVMRWNLSTKSPFALLSIRKKAKITDLAVRAQCLNLAIDCVNVVERTALFDLWGSQCINCRWMFSNLSYFVRMRSVAHYALCSIQNAVNNTFLFEGATAFDIFNSTLIVVEAATWLVARFCGTDSSLGLANNSPLSNSLGVAVADGSVILRLGLTLVECLVEVTGFTVLLNASQLLALSNVSSTLRVLISLDSIALCRHSSAVYQTGLISNESHFIISVKNCSSIAAEESTLLRLRGNAVGSISVAHCALIYLKESSSFLVAKSIYIKSFVASNLETIRCANNSRFIEVSAAESIVVTNVKRISLDNGSIIVAFDAFSNSSRAELSQVNFLYLGQSWGVVLLNTSEAHTILIRDIDSLATFGLPLIQLQGQSSQRAIIVVENIAQLFVLKALIVFLWFIENSVVVLRNVSYVRLLIAPDCLYLSFVRSLDIVRNSTIIFSNIRLTNPDEEWKTGCSSAACVLLSDAENVAIVLEKFSAFLSDSISMVVVQATATNVSLIARQSFISFQSEADDERPSALIDLAGRANGWLRITMDNSSVLLPTVACDGCFKAFVQVHHQNNDNQSVTIVFEIVHDSELTLQGTGNALLLQTGGLINQLEIVIAVSGASNFDVNGVNATIVRMSGDFVAPPEVQSVLRVTVIAAQLQKIHFRSLGALYHAVNTPIHSRILVTVSASAVVSVSPNGSLVYIRDGLLVAAHEISITFHCTVAVNQSAVFVIQGLRGTGAQGVGMRLSLDSRNNTLLRDMASVALISSLSEANVTLTASGLYLLYSTSASFADAVDVNPEVSIRILSSSAIIVLVPLLLQAEQGWLLRCLASGASCDALLMEVTLLNTTIAYVVIPALATSLASVVVPMFADVRRFAQGSQFSAPQCDSWVLHLTSSGDGLNIAAMLENSYFSASHEILSRRRLDVIDFGGASDVVAVVGLCSLTQSLRRRNSGNVTLSASVVAVPPGPEPPLPRLLTPEAKSAVVTFMAATSLATATSEAATVVLLVGTNCAQATAASSSPPIPLLWWHLAVIGASLPVANYFASKVLLRLSMTKGTFPSLASTRFPHFSLCACNFLVPVVLSYGIGSGSAAGVATSIAAAVAYCGAVLWMSHRFLDGASIAYVAYPPDVHAAMERRLLDRWLQPRKRWLPIDTRRGLGFLFASMDGYRRQWKLLEVGLGLVAGVLTGTAKSLRATEGGCQVSVATLAVLYAVAAVGFAVIRPHRLPSDAALVPVMFAVLSALCWLQAFAALEGDIIEVFIMLSSVVSLIGLLISVAVGVRESAFEAMAVAMNDVASLDDMLASKEPADCVDDPRHRLRQQEVRKKKAALVGAVAKRLKTLVSGLELAVLEAMMMDDSTVDIRERFLCELITMVCEYKTAEREIV